jgi:hypothetical protein
VSFAAISFCIASQRVFIIVVYFVMTQSGNFWIHPRTVVKYRITGMLCHYATNFKHMKHFKIYLYKVKLSLCFTKHYAMKTYCGGGVITPRIL